MSGRTLKQKRKKHFLNSEIVYVDMDRICTDKSGNQSYGVEPANKQIVRKSVELYEYDDDAPPLLVFPHSYYEDYYQLLDGFERLEGALENNSIKQLPCIVIKAKNLAEARLIASAYNASVHNVRDKKNLAYNIIDTLDKSYRNRNLTKDLSISREELLYLSALSGESETTCNRALAVFRDIFNEMLTENPDCAFGGLKKCFLGAIKTGKYPELKDFYEKDISVLSFSDRRFEGVNKLAPGEKRRNRQQKQKNTQVQQISETAARSNFVITESDVIQTEDDLRIAPITLNSNEDSREIDFINQLKAMSSIDEIDLSAAKEMIQDFLLNNPNSKGWVNSFFNCVNRFWSELQLFLSGEIEQPKSSRPKQIAKLAAADNVQTGDGQQLLF